MREKRDEENRGKRWRWVNEEMVSQNALYGVFILDLIMLLRDSASNYRQVWRRNENAHVQG